MTTVNIELPKKLVPVFLEPRGSYRYRGAYGGRGSGKSVNFAKMSAVFGYMEPIRVLCCREFQVSIKESFYAEVKKAIESEPWLSSFYTVGESYIKGENGTEYIFKGLRHNMSSIKSMAKIDLCVIEEAEDISESSWVELIPTIRAERSEIWPIWNPKKEGSPVDSRFLKSPPESSIFVKMNYWDNPFFPYVLDQERKNDLSRLDSATYAHIWEGEYLKNSKSQIFADKIEVMEFEDPEGVVFYHGVDYGFSQDPTFATRSFILGDCLYISRESVKIGLELDDTVPFIKAKIPGFENYASYGDSSRPETTNHLQRHGFPKLENVKKWKGSVEDGVSFLKSFKKIIIHPRCPEMIKEGRLYSYKVDRLTGDIQPEIVDAYNHGWDSVRYAFSKMIRNENFGILDVL